jgi:hypothetical protein
VGFEAMCPAPQQHVDVHLPRHDQQAVRIGRRNDGVAMCEAYPQRAMCDDFGEGEAGSFRVVIAFDDLEIGRDGAEVVVRFPVGEIAQADDLADFSGGEELFKLREAGG